MIKGVKTDGRINSGLMVECDANMRWLSYSFE